MEIKINSAKSSVLLKNIQKTLAAVFIAAVFLFSPAKTHAALWPAIDPQYKQMLEEIHERITGIMLGMLKQQAMTMLNQQIGKLVGGTSTSSAMFITDWQSYLVKEPEEKTRLYMNDYLSQVTKGRGSSTGYVGEGFSGSGSYSKQLVEIGKKTTVDKPAVPQMTYESDPSQMFAGGNFKNLSLYLSGINNPWAFSIDAQSKYQKKLEEEKKIAETKAVANEAWKSNEKKVDDKGKTIVITPGSVIKEAYTNTQDLGNKIIASATHPEEIISAVVQQMITKAIQQGVGEIEKAVQKEFESVSGKIGSQLKSQTSTTGPGTQYKSEYAQWLEKMKTGR
ncbi:MAG: hypothetical protein A2288_01960 [Candidatus Moranbacteria bacterium RIFOXYA12_FULL_44_15]|nr:MAG: hypothetical protein A2288_01960 [Candidatus Moranbacteria bacterium RIFOXYA12_FULL_44_15]OGI35457.1 MAG: hypothetical protein A2259_02415 [Candidatus Moranbacteria bacterium RIFOXYA2_FULL_43_15]